MTDKPIIIDGVDVSGCQHFCKNDPCKNTCQYFATPCEWVDIQNCMYKYAKRKEQECEKLNKVAKTHLAETFEMQKEIDQLKEKNEDLTKMLQNPEVIVALTDVRTGERDIWRKLGRKAEKYKQTLQEIKEIAEKVLKECNNCDQYSCSGCPDENKDELAKQILNKINEVEDDF